MSKVIEIIDSDDDNNNNTPTSSSNALINNSETDDNHQTHSRRRRRKSILHAMPDPDMQFQTISLEDDDEGFFITNSNPVNIPAIPPINNHCHSSQVPASRTLLKTQKIAPKIQANKSSAKEIVDAHFEKFLNDPETVNDIYAIAEERARINYLLSLNGISEINFNLYVRPELLQLQLEQRLKQRKTCNNWDGTSLLENRRGVVPNDED